MPDTPTRTDTPPPPKPPDQSLRPSPEMQQKLDTFRAQKEARQDAGEAVDHRAAKAENLAAREAARKPNADSGTGVRPHGDHYRNETGAGPGPWFDEGTNHRDGGAVQQTTEGSCVSAAGEMLTDGRVSQEQLLARLNDWSNPTALRDELNERDGGGWQGHYFASGDDAVRQASEGPMGAVVQAPGGAGHMVMLEPRSDGTFTVRDPYENSSYDVNSGWIDKYVSAGVWQG